ncbi:MAG: EF-hand domain pair [Deltaproteobacteria bacterium]|nr:EF-hand domain pair [Deltaproteobacteria bacterium]
MKKIILAALLFFAVLFLTWNVYAGADAFTKADKNADGYISKDESESHIKSKFNEYDKNKDGTIDSGEFGAKGDPESLKEFRFMDRNSDGFVNADEFYKAALQRRDDFDFNRDGKISREEYSSNKALPLLKFYF